MCTTTKRWWALPSILQRSEDSVSSKYNSLSYVTEWESGRGGSMSPGPRLFQRTSPLFYVLLFLATLNSRVFLSLQPTNISASKAKSTQQLRQYGKHWPLSVKSLLKPLMLPFSSFWMHNSNLFKFPLPKLALGWSLWENASHYFGHFAHYTF